MRNNYEFNITNWIDGSLRKLMLKKNEIKYDNFILFS